MYAIIGLTVGVFTGVGLMRILAMVRDSETPPCPHGHKDWDDCPDCRH